MSLKTTTGHCGAGLNVSGLILVAIRIHVPGQIKRNEKETNE